MSIFLSLKIKLRKRGTDSLESIAVKEFVKQYNITDLNSFTKGYQKWYYEIPEGRYIWD